MLGLARCCVSPLGEPALFGMNDSSRVVMRESAHRGVILPVATPAILLGRQSLTPCGTPWNVFNPPITFNQSYNLGPRLRLFRCARSYVALRVCFPRRRSHPDTPCMQVIGALLPRRLFVLLAAEHAEAGGHAHLHFLILHHPGLSWCLIGDLDRHDLPRSHNSLTHN